MTDRREDPKLFRDEVVQAKSARWLGATRLAAPVSHTVWTGTAALLAALVIAVLVFGQYTRRVRTTGMIVPSSGLITLKSRIDGTVVSLERPEGSPARKGAVLVSLSSERVSSMLGGTAEEVRRQLNERAVSLNQDETDRKILAQEQRAGLSQQYKSLDSQVRQVSLQIETQEKDQAIQRELLRRMRSLGKERLVSLFDEQRQELAALNSDSTLAALNRQKAELERQRGSVGSQIAQISSQTHLELSDIRRNLTDTSRLIAQNEAERLSILTSPVDGTVSSLLVKPGQAVMIGQPLMHVVPAGSRMQAQLLVPSDAIGFVRVGNPVALQYKAYPYQRFGLHKGKVVSISRSAISPAELPNVANNVRPDQSYYKVIVALDDQTVMAYGKHEALLPGMALDADLMLDRRRLFEWIFEPLYGMGRRMQFAEG